MLRQVSRLFCVCYLDGTVSDGVGYRFTIHSAGYGIGYSAYHTVSGLRYFMKHYGLTVDKETAELCDFRNIGHGRRVCFQFEARRIEDRYFWHMEEVPAKAEPFIGLENGSYVTLYALRGNDYTVIYRPNPNAKEVYRPFDWREVQKVIG